MNDAKRVQIMMPEILIEQIDKIAEDNIETRSSVVRRAIREYLRNTIQTDLNLLKKGTKNETK